MLVALKSGWGFTRRCLRLAVFSMKIYCELFLLWARAGFSPVLLAHGSLGDQFLAASLLDEYVSRNGRTIVIISSGYQRVFELFVDQRDVVLLGLSERRCQRLTECWQIVFDMLSPARRGNWLSPTFRLRPMHVVRYPGPSNAVAAYMRGGDGLHHMAAQRKVLNLPLDGYGKRPKYTTLDELEAHILFKPITNDLSKVALISPICYTHHNMDSGSWLSVAKALERNGFMVVFNVAGNVGAKDLSGQIVPPEFPSIKVPAHLAPKVGTLCGLICGRVGGGFFIFQSILRPRRSLLVVLNQDDSVPLHTRDPSAQIVLKSCASFFGNDVDHVVVLEATDRGVIIEEKISRSLQITVR